jgi:hypothetical protein
MPSFPLQRDPNHSLPYYASHAFSAYHSPVSKCPHTDEVYLRHPRRKHQDKLPSALSIRMQTYPPIPVLIKGNSHYVSIPEHGLAINTLKDLPLQLDTECGEATRIDCRPLCVLFSTSYPRLASPEQSLLCMQAGRHRPPAVLCNLTCIWFVCTCTDCI